MTSPVVTLVRVFFDGDRGFEHHTTEFVNENGELFKFKVFAYVELHNGLIQRFEDVTVQIEGSESMASATSTN